MPIPHAHLRSFNAVATHGSFTRAAEILHVSQPTISGQVKELEQRYATKLFVRHGRHIELTDIGQSVFSITRKIFRHEAEVEQLLSSARTLTSGRLQVAADSPYIVTPLIARFQRLYPGINVSIRYGNSAQLMSWIDNRRCDVAFLPNIPADDGRLFSISLSPDRLVAFVSQDHPWSSRHAVSLSELATQKVILREKGSNTRFNFESALQESQVELTQVMEISGREGVREAVAAGLGIGVVSENELGADSRLVSLVVSDAELVNQEFVVCLNELRGVDVIRTFLDLVLN